MKKKVIYIDPVGDYDVNWKWALWKEAWKGVYISKDLRDIIKIKFDEKTNTIIIKPKKKKK